MPGRLDILISFSIFYSFRAKARRPEEWHDGAVKSLGKIYGTSLSLNFDGYGCLKPDASGQSVLGPLIEPIETLNRHQPLADTGPWPANEPLVPHLALAIREVQWLESKTGRQLFNVPYTRPNPCRHYAPYVLALPSPQRCVLACTVPRGLSLQQYSRIARRPHGCHWRRRLGVCVTFTTVGCLCCAVFDSRLWGLNPEWRMHKARLRMVFAQAVVEACPNVMVVAQADESTGRSIYGLRLVVYMATSGVALDASFKEMGTLLAKLRENVKVDAGLAVEKIDLLVALFSQPV
jgi:hypothetical protein